MAHKIAYLKQPRHIYIKTKVPVERSFAQIEKMLQQSGCSRIAMQKDYRGDIPLFTLLFEKDTVPFVIEFPVVYDKKELRPDLGARIIHDRIKALLIEVEIGVSPFSAAMMQFRALPDPNTGSPIPLESFISENPQSIAQGQFGDIQILQRLNP